MGEKPDCYKCEHRRKLVSNAHSKCVHPLTGKGSRNEIRDLISSIGTIPISEKAVISLDVKAHSRGVEMGWFAWPVNFDPVWLLSCSGFEEKEGA